MFDGFVEKEGHHKYSYVVDGEYTNGCSHASGLISQFEDSRTCRLANEQTLIKVLVPLVFL
jgi:hypothetical protein